MSPETLKTENRQALFKGVFPREKYLQPLRPFYQSDVIKVITGIRRCGKSFLLKAVINELVEQGVDLETIVYIPLDKRGFKSITTPEQLEAKIEEVSRKIHFCYLLIDEVQNVKGFEPVVQAYAEEGWSIFLTGSNSYLLSDEITTKLTGRYLAFDMFTLDFQEYMDMKVFHGLPVSDDLYVEFEEYIQNGGFPKALEFNDIDARLRYTQGIVQEIFEKDVKTRSRISNVAVYERVQSFLINNYAAPFSLTNLVEYLRAQGIPTKAQTVRRYIGELKKAKIIYECNRFDLKSKRSVARDQKYYLADLSLYFATNTDNRLSYGPSLENIIYIYLLSQGYAVSVGRIGNLECDFITRNAAGNYAYIQVAYSLHGETDAATAKIKEREYRPFRSIRDGYPRYIISLDRLCDQQEGVHHINALDLFTQKMKLWGGDE